MTEQKLKFSTHNSKIMELGRYTGLKSVSFDLPAGHTCPFADKCLTFTDRITGKITDGKDQKFRCYAASSEAAFTNVRKMRWYNFELLNGLSINNMAQLISDSIPNKTKIVRLHSSGDFYNSDYFKAWIKVAKMNPEINFFGYTKGLMYVREIKPENFKLVYSYGGKLDSKVTKADPVSYVVENKFQADAMGLTLPCEINPSGDYFTILNGESFALKLHGTQPAMG